jgi:phosphoserine aminotransferase
MSRPFNFAAGPSALPETVLERAREELLDWHGCGMSVMEINHRGSQFKSIAESAESRLRRLMRIPDGYAVLFLHGPARSHFSAVPLNLLGEADCADYVDTGLWSKMAIDEAERYCKVNVSASSRDRAYTYIPDEAEWRLEDKSAYLHITPNETIGGVEYQHVPDVDGRVLVADMSSNILSRALDVARFGLIYAGAQKNMGIAGLTIVIVREELLGRARAQTPLMMNYEEHAKGASLACTAPTFAWYMADLVLEWVEKQGGVARIEEVNRRKAEKLYGCIDSSNYYNNPVDRSCRSRMNVPFTLPSADLDETFLGEARDAGLVGLKGHRFVGGMRASIYNAMPEEGVDRLVEFMRDFMRRHG